MADLGVILGDLDAETRTIDDVVADLPASGWARETPAVGWTIAHQIAHLAWTDRKALIAAAHPEDWQAEVEELLKAGATYVDDGAAAGAQRPPREILDDWRSGRAALAEALAAVPEGQKLPWYGPPMSAASMATARMMETWAHGQDVFDALGLTREPTARLRHVARFGTRARDFALPCPAARAAGGGVPRRADRARRRAPGRTARRTPNRRVTGPRAGLLPARHPAAAPGRHRVWSRTAPTPTSGSTSRRPSPARPGTAGSRGSSHDLSAIGNCSGFYGDRFAAMREMLDRRPARRPHRRLPRRADHADPRPRPAEGPERAATPRRSCASWRTASAWRWSGACEIVANAGGLNPAGLADALPRAGRPARPRRHGSRTSRATTCSPAPTELGLGEPLTANAYLGGWGIAACLRGGRRRRRHRPGHRRARWSSGRPPRTSAGRRDDYDAPRRRGRRRARPRVRHPGHRRQLRLLHRHSPGVPARLPARRDRRRRLRVITKHPAPAGW